MINKEMFAPSGSEITSPLAEHLAAFVMTARAHVVCMMDDRQDYEAFQGHSVSALAALEMLSDLVGDHVFTSAALSV